MKRSFTTTLVAAASLSGAFAQGDPEALTGSDTNNPTKSWTQWQPKPTYALDNLPDQYMGANRIPGYSEPQYGFNNCADGKWNQDSKCQTAHINDISDWCVWGPPEGGEVGATERIAVAYCTTGDHGTRLLPDGTITGAHFLQTPNYVQVTGLGDFTKIGIPAGDAGGEMDNHGADDLGNPIGGVIFTTANPESNGQPQQAQQWTNFMSSDMFCLRACWGNDAAKYCEHIYDVMGCRWNMPSETGYTADIFESCEGDNAPFAGIYGSSTFSQGQPVTPEAHPPAPSSNCQSASSISHGLLAAAVASPTSEAAATSAPGAQSSSSSSAASTATSDVVDAANPSSTNSQQGAGSLTSASNANRDDTNGAVGLAPSLSFFAIGMTALVAILAL